MRWEAVILILWTTVQLAAAWNKEMPEHPDPEVRRVAQAMYRPAVLVAILLQVFLLVRLG